MLIGRDLIGLGREWGNGIRDLGILGAEGGPSGRGGGGSGIGMNSGVFGWWGKGLWDWTKLKQLPFITFVINL